MENFKNIRAGKFANEAETKVVENVLVLTMVAVCVLAALFIVL